MPFVIWGVESCLPLIYRRIHCVVTSEITCVFVDEILDVNSSTVADHIMVRLLDIIFLVTHIILRDVIVIIR